MGEKMRARDKRKSLNRPMQNVLYPVYEEDKPRIVSSLESRLSAYQDEKQRNIENWDGPRADVVDAEIRAYEDLLYRLKALG